MTPHADLSDPIHPPNCPTPGGDGPPAGGLPDFLTVTEAARLLRIGRTSAYQLAQQWCDTEGREGLPVVRVGRLLRVPRHELERLAGGELTAAPSPPPSSPAPPTSPAPSYGEPPTRATMRSRATAPKAGTPRGEDRGTQASLFPSDR